MTAPYLLLVEDTPQTRLLIEEVVKFVLPAYDVITASNPPEALELIATRRPDVIITDLKMPGMDGYAFMQTLEADPNTAGIPLLVMTAFANQDEDILIRRKLREIGLTRPVPIMTKPFSIQVLRQTLEALVEGRYRDDPLPPDA